MKLTLILSAVACGITSVLADPSISTFPNALALESTFDPIKSAYWTGLPHHRRTPFSLSPDGKSAYIAYLDATYSNVVVQQVNVDDFTAVGTPVSIEGYEAGGLVAHNDGFALMATVNATGTTDLPINNAPIVALIRYTNGVETWRTPLNGPGVHAKEMLTATPDANGDLVYSPVAGMYASYFVVTAYTSDYAGHFGDSIQYVNSAGELQDSQYSSSFGCSHNTGIGLEAADAAPFASVCAEDQGAIWLNTETQYMSGVKIANENTTNGVSGEPMGGMSGSYSNLANFPGSTKYIFAWQSRGALDLTVNAWMGSPNTQCKPRWLNHNVAITTMSDKSTLTGEEATSVIGAAEGDTQVTWITESTTDDHQNVHVAALSSDLSIVTWETLSSPDCQPVPLSCSGTYAGTSFQLVDSTGAKVGAAVSSTEAFVSGDIVTFSDSKVCWPYVDMTWDLSRPASSGAPVSKMSFACASTGDSSAPKPSSSAAAAVVTSSSAASIPADAATSSAVESPTSVVAIEVPSSVAAVEIPTSVDAVEVPTSVVAGEASVSTTATELPTFSDLVEPIPTTITDISASQTATASIASSLAVSSSSTRRRGHFHGGHSHARPSKFRGRPTTASTAVAPPASTVYVYDDVCEW